MTQSSAAVVAVTPTWQNPYVEVIRYGLAHANVGCQQHGDVEQATDRQIQKNVFKIRGTIAATNYVRFPREVSKSNQGLGLTGRYVYIQLRRARGQQATLHLDLLTAKKSALRFSFSSMFTGLRSSGSVLRVPLDVSDVWTTIAVDMANMLQLHGLNGYSRESYRYLKAVTCCASMNLRNVFTSSTCFTPQTLPLHLALPSAHENQFGPFTWLALPYALGVRRSLPNQVEENEHSLRTGEGSNDARLDVFNGEIEVEEHEDEVYIAAASPPMPASSMPMAEITARLSSGAQFSTPVDRRRMDSPPLSPSSRTAGLIRDREDILSRADQIMRDAGFSVPSPRRRASTKDRVSCASPTTYGHPSAHSAESVARSPRQIATSDSSDWPDPILSLKRIIGFSTTFPRALRWIPDASVCVYTSYSTIILREFTSDAGGHAKQDAPPLVARHAHHHGQDPVRSSWASRANSTDTGEPLTNDHEVFLMGHTGEICAIAVSQDGALLASAQNTPQCVLRLWDLRRESYECLLVMKAPTKSIHALTFSKDATAICCVGSDHHARTQILVWDASSLLAPQVSVVSNTKKFVLRARQTCDFHVTTIAFSPYETDQLVSCGKENVRFWRIHQARHHLPGSPVILKEYSRSTVFTDVAFDSVYPQFPSNLPRVRPVYVSSSMGSIVVIDYDTREIACVYKLHNAAIHSICVNEGFCVTGSDDKYLRVWPLDFSDFFLEAEHEAPVQSVDISSDGMRVAVGTTSGAIGVLHLADRRYRTVLRSHTEPVRTLGSLANDAFVSSGPDGTLRVWAGATGTQTMEFDVSKDLVTCLTAMPSESADDGSPPETIAVGFHSGCTRIFSLGSSIDKPGSENLPTEPRVLFEFQQHQSPLSDVQYQGDAKTLYTSASGQQLCMYDVTKGYAPIKMLIADMDTDHGKMCLSRDGRFVAVLQQGRQSVLLLDTISLHLVRVLTPPKPAKTSTMSESNESRHELTQMVISWNSQELLALSRADRLHVFSLAETHSGSRASIQLGAVIHSMPLLGQEGITSFALSPNLKYFATGGSNSSVRIWQCEFGRYKSQRMNQTFRLHAGQGAVRGLAFSSDGHHIIATSDRSSAIFVWRFRGNTSKLPSLGLHNDATATSRQGTQEGHKTDFELPLDDISNKTEVISTEHETGEASPTPVEKAELKVSTSSSAHISWKQIVSAKATSSSSQCVAWACGIGCIISTVADGGVVVVEKVESGEQHFIHTESPVDQLVLSATHCQLAMLSTEQESAIVCDLRQLRQDENQTECEAEDEAGGGVVTLTTSQVRLPRPLAKFFAVNFSMDGALLCVSGEFAGLPELFVVDIQRRGELVWSVESPRPSFPITSIVSQSPREFLCAANDARKPLHRLRVPPFSLSAASLALEPTMEPALPTQPQVFCFRDDNVPFAQESDMGHQLWRCRFAAAIDSDAYCYFMDLERQRKIHTMQLLLPSPRTTAIAKMQWVGTSEWQALVATLSDHTIAVFSLPTQFVFSPTSQTRVAAVDWAQLKRTGRLTSTTVLSFDGQIPEQVLTDPLSDVGMVATRDGAVFTVSFHSGLRRLLRAAPTLELSAGDMRSAHPHRALSSALLITRSADRRTLQCWEPSLGRELARLHVANALCTCFTVSPFDVHLVAAGYQDGSVRVFDVNKQRLVTQWELPLLSQRGRPHRGGKSSGVASPAEAALSILKQKQATKQQDAQESPNNVHEKVVAGFIQLHFLGARSILAVTQSSRVVLFDLSDVSFTLNRECRGVEEVSGVTNTKRPAVSRQKQVEKVIHYRELHLPAPDQSKWITNSQRRSLLPPWSSNTTAWDVQVESIDVQLLGNRSPSKSQRHRDGNGDDDSGLASTQAFLVVTKVTSRTRKTSFTVAHVFAGTDLPAAHPVHAEEDAVPCDSWIVQASGALLFHPTNACQIVYAVLDDHDTAQWIEIRDFRAHTAVLRLALPGTEGGGGIPRGPLSLLPWQPQGKAVVMVVELLDPSSPASGRPIALVDLSKRVAMRVQHDGGVTLPISTTCGSGSSQLLLAVASSSCKQSRRLSSGGTPFTGFVIADITYPPRSISTV